MSRTNFLKRNQVPIRMEGQDYRHNEGLEPFHALVGWDARCQTCQQVQAYLRRLDQSWVHRQEEEAEANVSR